jgi:hypothetical protein
MEAITAYPAGGLDGYLVGGENGTVWRCGLSATCSETPLGELVPAGLGLTALAAFGPAGQLALLARAYDPRRGNRISLRLIDPARSGEGRIVDELTLAPPLTVDNFEGLAVVAGAAGSLRFYLLSDDNGSAAQRTYLLAFDWQQ